MQRWGIHWEASRGKKLNQSGNENTFKIILPSAGQAVVKETHHSYPQQMEMEISIYSSWREFNIPDQKP